MTDVSTMLKAWQSIWSRLLSDPQKLVETQMAYWQELMALWQKQPEPTSDRRFKSEAWHKYPLFYYIKENYLLNVKYLHKLIEHTPDLEPKISQRLRFYIEQFLNAVAPTNFVLTNPDVLQQTINVKGENLIKGMNNFVQDLKRSKQHFQISMTDMQAFKVGENLAISPGKVIYQNELIQLIQYTPTTKLVYEKPLLIIPPWINKFYIFDLQPHNSMVKWIVDQGYTVFIISWVNPDARYAHIEFSDYIRNGVLASLDVINQVSKSKTVNALGFCIGGTLLAATLATMAAKNDNRISSATYLATLLDFSNPGDLGVFIDEANLAAVENLMSKKGYLDGGYMSTTFNLLRSNDLIWSYYVNNYLRGETPFPYDVLYWNSDSTNMPAKMHTQYLREMYLNNSISHPDKMILNDVPIDLGKITVPSYVLATQQDHIAPWKAVYNSSQLFQSNARFVLGQAGHIVGAINPPTHKKYGYYSNKETPKNISADQWLAAAELHEGSWWIDWIAWLEKGSGAKVPARQPQKALEDAPGSYVKVRLDDVVE